MFKKIAAAGSALVLSAGSAFAAVPTEVTTALTDAKADVMTIAGLGLVIVIGVAAFAHMRRAAH